MSTYCKKCTLYINDFEDVDRGLQCVGGKPLRRYSHPSLVKMCYLRQVLQQQPIYLVDLCIKIVTTAKSNTFQSKRTSLLFLLILSEATTICFKAQRNSSVCPLTAADFSTGTSRFATSCFVEKTQKVRNTLTAYSIIATTKLAF